MILSGFSLQAWQFSISWIYLVWNFEGAIGEVATMELTIKCVQPSVDVKHSEITHDRANLQTASFAILK
ncbi:hypothetical protein [Fischerella sp. PCC 9605]|uniref:hypothetical protein n=1 Tax=Fischerella sp. PCC 9605 TaxID=1173024 RepID=UPI0004795042|nr:hypothetical protein [Fischerella sp. PCC 9605]